MGSEKAIISALNIHPQTEALTKYFTNKYGVVFEIQRDEHGGEGPEDFEVMSIKGDEDGVFDIEEMTGAKEVLEIYNNLLEKGINVFQEEPGVQELIEAKIKNT